jgi:hypothetical protein
MTTLPRYADLGTVHRTKPCVEYPGEWLVYIDGNNERSFTTQEDAIKAAHASVDEFPDADKISVCWKCSDDDPRQGQVWFTGFYQLGSVNGYGQWKA